MSRISTRTDARSSAWGVGVALLRSGDDILAFENICPHMGGSVGEGMMRARAYGRSAADVVCTPYNTSVRVPNRTQTGERGDAVDEPRRMKTLQMAASASFNRYYVLRAGKVGTEWGVEHVGGSSVISPWDEVLAAAEDEQDCPGAGPG